MNKKMFSKSTATVTIHEPAESPKKLIEEIMEGRTNNYVYEIVVVTEDTVIFDFTYDDWYFKVPVVCQLVANTYWVVTK